MKRKLTSPTALLIYISLILFPAICTSQKDYIITDTSTNTGIQLVDAGDVFNGQFIQQFIRDTILRFTPRDCKEYGFEDGRVYVRKSIASADTQQLVFLERIVNGKATLYYYNTGHSKSYFLEKDNGLLVQLLIPEGAQQISQLPEAIISLTSDCQGFSEMAEDANYKKKSFTQLIQRYNQCMIKPFPHFRYGILAGMGLHKINPPDAALDDIPLPFDYNYESAQVLGVFLDMPLNTSPFSIHVKAQYEDLHYSKTSNTDHDHYDMVVNISALQVPTTLRYTFPFRKFRPSMECGGMVTYYFDEEISIYHSIITDDLVEIQHVFSPAYISEIMAGYVFGLGLEYTINLKHSISLETQYMKQYILNGYRERRMKLYKSV
jgi:hypothetical protein